jgi:hypothetical protein
VQLRTCLVGRIASSVAFLAALVLGSACPGGNRSIGETCSSVSDCEGGLQCLDHTCVPECHRHADCGDGLQCQRGQCQTSPGAIGEKCTREVDCGAGLACHLEASDASGDNLLDATCAIDHEGGVLDAACDGDNKCRNGTCALGRCIDLCAVDTDCPIGHVCSSIPRVEAVKNSQVPSFNGCLPDRGSISWTLPVGAPVDDVWLPVPGRAKSIALVMSVSDASQRVGATRVTDPAGKLLYAVPATLDELYANPLRHQPEPGLSVILMPNTPALPLQPGAYHLTIGSFRANGQPASDTPRATVIAKLDTGTILDIHFYFLDLAAHPCAAAFDGGLLDATSAPTSEQFQKSYIGTLRSIFGRAGIALGTFTYDDLSNHPDLDGLDASDLRALLPLSTHPGGVNVFFVRTLSPAGMLALVGRTPGTPTLPGTAGSGVAVSLDALCYQDWPTLARVTAHALARHLGLYRNVEPDGHADPIPDSDASTTNLMYYGEYGGTDLSEGQREVLRTSPVLR